MGIELSIHQACLLVHNNFSLYVEEVLRLINSAVQRVVKREGKKSSSRVLYRVNIIIESTLGILKIDISKYPLRQFTLQ